ncbi:MAG: SWIM zinc finger family protein, partial [Micropruina sp.]
MDAPEWVTSLSDAGLARTFGLATLERGRQYAQVGRVGSISTGSGSLFELVHASVRGSGGKIYQTVISYDAPSGQLRASCSCPVGFACKHSAAVLVVLRRQARQPQLADWQQALATVVGAEPRPPRT